MRFLLVDRILELVPGERITSTKTLPAGEDVFRDHFPGFPVVPGVLLVEMMAQAAGKCLDATKSRNGKAMLGKIVSASFNQWVRPDEEAVIHATIGSNRTEFATAKCFVEVNGRKVCSSDLFFVFAPRENFSPDYVDEVLEHYLAKCGAGAPGGDG
jgi:3-hydroxyacyl-[acyl-carrier-protein] dehydratase